MVDQAMTNQENVTRFTFSSNGMDRPDKQCYEKRNSEHIRTIVEFSWVKVYALSGSLMCGRFWNLLLKAVTKYLIAHIQIDRITVIVKLKSRRVAGIELVKLTV